MSNMRTFIIKVNETDNVTLGDNEEFEDLTKKLDDNDIHFDVTSIEEKLLTEDSVVADNQNIDNTEVEDETVEFVLPDLPESAASISKDSNAQPICNGLLCRLCGIKTDDPIPIFSKFQDISQKISNLILVSITRDDQLSKHICTACNEKLEAINEFISVCKETEKKLCSITKSRSLLRVKLKRKADGNRENTIIVQDDIAIYKCPNCKVDLRITRTDGAQNCYNGPQASLIATDASTSPNSFVKTIKNKAHTSRSCSAKKRVGTRLGKASGKSANTGIEENHINDVEAIGATVNILTPLKSTRKIICNVHPEDDGSSNCISSREKGKMKLRDIRKRAPVCSAVNDVAITRKLESDALEKALFSSSSDLEVPGITGEFVELDALEDSSNEIMRKRAKFKCEACKAEYYSYERYLFHVERHGTKNFYEFVCNVCKKEFLTEDDLWEHHRYHHSNNSEGGETVSENVNALQPENNQRCTKSTCEECGARFVLRERYEFHMERHKLGNIKIFSCMICGKRFKSENILWDHYQYQHKSGERIACMTCNKTFVKRANLNYHLKTFGHKGGKRVTSQDQIRQTETDGDFKLSDISKSRPKITCSDCGARFVLQERYEFHMERHKTGRMDVCLCMVCGRESTNENVLWDHYQYMHKRTKRYACTTCGKLFHKQSLLSRHQVKYGHKGSREIDVDTDGNALAVDSAAFKKVIAEEVVEMKSVNCVLCGEVVWGVDPNLINDAVTCASCEGPGLSLQVDSDGAKVISRRQYHCNMCNKHFTTKDRLEYHIMRHSENMDEFICSTCGKELSTEQALFEHYLFVHKGARPHVCELCGKSYQFKARLKEHMRSHSGERPFACEICGQRCMTNNALRSHKKTHITEKRFPCQICKKAFRKRQDLNEHLERHWKNDKTMMFPQVFSCTVCFEMFPTFRILKKHMKETHRVKSPDPILTDLQPWFECEDCHEKFKHQMSLKVHRERKHEGKMRPVYHCDVCNVTYKNARVLSNHIKNKHEGGKRYKCAQCGKEYNQSTSLHNHILLHTGEKPFSCEHCEMTFRTKESRDHHQRKHTGERPYKCPRCDKSFATTTQRREHRKREHDEGNTHHCPECGKACFDEHGVSSHLNMHFSEKFKNTQENQT
ncbi:zinc finger protein 208 isoform X1 [Neodiprion lecontei]|uniref:Zinc finger protein 208 isoform X1 n=1 Tax=Neodiprion lecontei TaxID=441921 RepID=A0A6J0BYQ1_NEOLC|nr:zinc finger protein 208 isoform X1 [Neodiprion lecontei]XP_046592075.1 zinc finger protein 208 isoform X1 [Neodiprion lecontei]XP_046592076.1 zinc finger protein 208 isoform X1 [Neodiprion lecontei]